MPGKIESYGLIGDCHGAALVGRDGSIDWLCVPRFDSNASFAALLGDEQNGRWLVAPEGRVVATRRRYVGETLLLETEFETSEGVAAVLDCMPRASNAVDLVRVVEGRRGRVAMKTEVVIRFDYGSVVPWVTRQNQDLTAIAGPDMLHLQTPVDLHGEGLKTVGTFEVCAGERVPFVMTFHPSHLPKQAPMDAEVALSETQRQWAEWSSRSTYRGEFRDAVQRSLITLKALTYEPTGGIVAAPTTSLPEHLGGVRNWDYRFCWIRDAAITLYALMASGYRQEARAWREWLLRAVAGSPSQIHAIYGIAGERRLTEYELTWLSGYEGSRPVRVGNGAHTQLQLDAVGHLLDAMHQCRSVGLDAHESWRVESALLDFLESNWQEPDEGIWEVRGPRRNFTHSKVMAWVAFDRAVKAIERFGFEGPVDHWKRIRDAIHAETCERAFDSSLGSFTQYYGSGDVDAALLQMPLVGFLPADDPRVKGTLAAVERELLHHGFVYRYRTRESVDGLPGGEGAFLACSFWYVDNLVMQGRVAEARGVFERLLAVRNDLGLLAEEYDPLLGRQLGNFPQAFSHLALVNSAHSLSHLGESPAEHRSLTSAPASVRS
jgi:GH15 family glucan-1,4-alpha-glucosidase